MDRDSMLKLRLDRRLIQRRGWISPEELDGALQALPDVASKATTLGDVTDPEAGAAGGADAGESGAKSGA